MPYPIQNVNAFSEAELFYIYQQLVEINTNTSGGGGGGLSQTELFEVFNGTNPQGLAISLFNQLNGLGIADQLSETLSGGDVRIADLLVDTLSGFTYSLANLNFLQLQSLGSIDSNCASIQTNTSSIKTSTNNIDLSNANIETFTGNTANYLSAIRTPVLTSITGSLTIAVQIHNLSVYNSGASAGTINVDGGGAISIPAGVTINFDAGGNNNRYAINKFVLNATGTTFLVSYTA